MAPSAQGEVGHDHGQAAAVVKFGVGFGIDTGQLYPLGAHIAGGAVYSHHPHKLTGFEVIGFAGAEGFGHQLVLLGGIERATH